MKLMIIRIDSKLLYTVAVLIALLMGVWLYQVPAVWTTLPLTGLVSGKRVVIDAGHGGYDPGAKAASGLLEKDINLDIALQLKKYLARVGIFAELVREDDRDFLAVLDCITRKTRDLDYRLNLIRRSQADILLSIHANTFTEPAYKGAQIFFKPGDPASKRLAICLQEYLVRELGPNRRKPKPGDFRILREVSLPAVIVETGFLSNPEEAELLATTGYREKVAAAIGQGVIGYFSGLAAGLEEQPQP